MVRNKAEDVGGLAPAKDDNAVRRYLHRRTSAGLRVDHSLEVGE